MAGQIATATARSHPSSTLAPSDNAALDKPIHIRGKTRAASKGNEERPALCDLTNTRASKIPVTRSRAASIASAKPLGPDAMAIDEQVEAAVARAQEQGKPSALPTRKASISSTRPIRGLRTTTASSVNAGLASRPLKAQSSNIPRLAATTLPGKDTKLAPVESKPRRIKSSSTTQSAATAAPAPTKTSRSTLQVHADPDPGQPAAVKATRTRKTNIPVATQPESRRARQQSATDDQPGPNADLDAARVKRVRTAQHDAPEASTSAVADEEPVKARESVKGKEKAGEIIEQWDDLDAGDEDDQLMVKEYVVEIYDYLRDLELTTLPDPYLMDRQVELDWSMRDQLVDWVIDVHTRFRLLPETLFLAINIVDRFLSIREVSVTRFQLVGTAALFIACKYEEVVSPSIKNFCYVTDGGYEEEEILKAERYILSQIQWNLSYPNPVNFLRRISKADHYDVQSRTVAKYFLELSLVDRDLIGLRPSLIAASSMWLSRKILARGPWDSNLSHYSGYTEEELAPAALMFFKYVQTNTRRIKHEGKSPLHTALHKKYASKKFSKASEYVKEWVDACPLGLGRITIDDLTGLIMQGSHQSRLAKRRIASAPLISTIELTGSVYPRRVPMLDNPFWCGSYSE
ncbi:hypothetical protein E5Q_02590 [Mixia osmundae IAM 14324]|uniref:Uncharacterized protein n=1 Tax=Mixia osmundae (strain CBS 9802 / IAM 14324 / JCM 22182 / KY 12970) TaxID=764103 RepID=G7DZC2_MIXOS|nr:hypothetical protein E5Q_02590 [Mixia osmundae IAM 14324]